MTLKAVLYLASALLSISSPTVLLAVEWYVDASASASGDGAAWATAFQTIEEGIDGASDGDTVIVAEGIYEERIHLSGKNIVLRSIDPLDANVVSNTVIACPGEPGPVVTLSGTENETCVLSGFTIKDGNGGSGGGICGGTWENRTLATIEYNVIISNSADYGGGIACCDGLIQGNTISDNSALYSGGGLIWCDGIIEGNTISRNSSELGGGLCACQGSIQYNLICSNEAPGSSFGLGGGLLNCDGAIAHNVIGGNRSGYAGGGLIACRGIVRNNTVVGNWAGNKGGGIRECPAGILNCIISGNSAANGDPDIGRSRTPEYSLIGGNPRFVDPDGPDDDPDTYEDNDYRLQPDSPCIDAGRNEDWMWHTTDLGANPRILRGSSSLTVDIGAFEYAPSAPAVNTWYVDVSVLEAGDGTSWDTAFQEIQEGIDAASNGDTVIVAEGTYFENIEFKGKNIILRSELEGAAVSTTIIDGGQAGSVVTFLGTEDENCVLRGFTIRNGNAGNGGGVNGQGLGVGGAEPRIENCVITGNSANRGGGISFCSGPIVNCTVCGNEATEGSGVSFCGRLINCIVWGNSGGDQMDSSAALYSCVQNSTLGGEGNIVQHPYFEGPLSGDYHLKSWSPCTDRGHRASGFSEELGSNGRRVNMGAYGNTAEAAVKSPDADKDGLPDNWEIEFFGHLGYAKDDDPDGDRLSNAHEWNRGTNPALSDASPAEVYVDASVKASGDGMTWGTAFKTIREGIDAARDGDIVTVAEGTYRWRIVINGKNITLRSKDPLDTDVVSTTIIEGGGGGSVVTFSGTEDETCVLSGFTIQKGKAVYGGGICGGTPESRTLATIEYNVIVDNAAEMGGGLAYCDGRINENTIHQNTTCQTTAAGAYSTGGGLASCNGLIECNTISGNSANRLGGGLAGCNGTIRNNLVSRNFAPRYTSYDSYGGGLSVCYGAIQNNTVVDNTAYSFGGLMMCHGPISGCIIWRNKSDISGAIENLTESRTPVYSCLQGDCSGEGSTCDDPRFIDPEGGNYHLRADSTLIDSGLNAEWMEDAVDLDGNPRIWLGKDSLTVDVGAYEYGSFPFKITEIAMGAITWNSQPGDRYAVHSCADLSHGAWEFEATVPSQGEKTSWSDFPTTAASKFYRIEMTD